MLGPQWPPIDICGPRPKGRETRRLSDSETIERAPPRRGPSCFVLGGSVGSASGHVGGDEAAVGQLLADLLDLVDQRLVDVLGDLAEAHAVFGDGEDASAAFEVALGDAL